MTQFSENFKFLRKEKGHTQDSLAMALGMTRASICAYEDGRAMPPYPKLKTLADALDCSVAELTEKNIENSSSFKNVKSINKIEGQTKLSLKNTEQDLSDYVLNQPFGKIVGSDAKPTFDPIKIPVLEHSSFATYLNGTREEIRRRLPHISLSLPNNSTYLAFASSDDFPMGNSLIIGLLIPNLLDIQDGKRCIVVSKTQGIIYRKVYNQVKSKCCLLLSAEVSGIGSLDLPISEIEEVWEVKAFFSYELPEPKPDLKYASKLAKDLDAELNRFLK